LANVLFPIVFDLFWAVLVVAFKQRRIKRLGLLGCFEISSQLPPLKQRLDSGDKGRNLVSELVFGFSSFKKVQKLLADPSPSVDSSCCRFLVVAVSSSNLLAQFLQNGSLRASENWKVWHLSVQVLVAIVQSG
jgi:hypothetical protein